MQTPIRLIGPTRITVQDADVPLKMPRKSWALLAYLILARGRRVPREEISATLWPKSEESSGRASLRQELSTLKSVLDKLGIGKLDAGKGEIALEIPPEAVDVLAFEQVLARRDSDNMRLALHGFTGVFLQDLRIRSDRFDEWVWLERQRQKNIVIQALSDLLEQDLRENAVERIRITAQKMLDIEPTHETAIRALMRVHRDLGDGASALRLFRQAEVIIRKDLDATPSLETRALADEIRDQASGRSKQTTPAARREWMAIAVVTLVLPPDQLDGIGPDELMQAQNRFCDWAAKHITAQNGQVLPTMGDRIIAVFPDEMGKSATAADAAKAIQTIVSEPVAITRNIVISARAGIAVGPIILTRANTPAIAGTALQNACNAAATARAGEIVVEHQVLKLLGRAAENRAILPYAPPHGLRVLERF